MTRAALRSRNDRHAKKYLKDTFGTDDPEVVKAKLKAAEEYERTKEEQRVATLTSEQRLQEQVAKERQRAERFKTQYQNEVRSQAIRTSDQVVRGIGEKFLKPKFLGGDVYRQLGVHLTSTYSRKQLEQLETEGKIGGVIEQWFGKFAGENPELTTGYEASLRAGGAPPPVRQPITNGANVDERPAPPNGAHAEQSFAPSAQNAMNSQQARAAAQKMGINWD